MGNTFKGITDKLTEHTRLMEHWMQGYTSGQQQQRSQEDTWVPAMDILVQQSGDLLILIELPGVGQEDIELSISEGELTISGEKQSRDEEAEYYTRERYFGTFSRTINVPEAIGEDRVSCGFEGCLLTITIRDYTGLFEEKRIEIGGDG